MDKPDEEEITGLENDISANEIIGCPEISPKLRREFGKSTKKDMLNWADKHLMELSRIAALKNWIKHLKAKDNDMND